jgi:hypothetical protein
MQYKKATMIEILTQSYSHFSKELNNDIETSAPITLKLDISVMRTLISINHTMLLTKGQIKNLQRR